jgi:hypothetical protein
MRTIRFMLLGAVLLGAGACGGKAAPATTPKTTDATAEPAPAGGAPTIDSVCAQFVSSVMDANHGELADDDNSEEECHTKLEGVSAAELEIISQCFDTCGVNPDGRLCVWDYNTDGFPPCQPDAEGEDEDFEDEGE